MERLKFDGDRVILGFSRSDVEQSPDSLFHLVIERIAHGPSMKAAAGLARNIQCNYEQRDSLLMLAPWYSFDNADRFRAQQVRFVLLGGKEIGTDTLLRWYVLHVLLLPFVIVIFMAIHFWRVRKDGGISGPL